MALLFTSVASVSAQALTSGADFLKVDSGARSQGMGGAFTAVADDVNALTWNPAGLALLTHPQVGYLRMLYVSDISYNFGGVAVPLPAGENSMGLGAGFVNLGTGTFDSTGGVATPISAGDNAFFFSFAYRVRDLVSFGATAKYVLRGIATYNAGAFGGDLGVLVTPPDLPVRIGLGVFNLGQDLQFISSADPLPMTGRLGLSYRTELAPRHSLTLAGDFSYQFAASLWEGAVGAEYWYDGMVAVRAGYRGNTDSGTWTAGAGVNLKVAELDYAYSPLGTLGDTHRMSLLFRLGEEPGAGSGAWAAPSGLTATALDSTVSLSWKASGEAAGYNLYLKKANGTFAKLTQRPVTDTTAKFTKLKNGTSYTFAVSSVSQAGRESPLVQVASVPKAGLLPSPASASGRVEGPAPSRVEGFKASPKGEGVELTWDPVPGAAGYNLYMMDVGGGPGKKLTAKPVAETRLTLKKLNAEKTYRFLLTAVSSSGQEGAPTEPPLTVKLSDLRKAPSTAGGGLLPPPGFTAVAGDGQVKLSWEAAEGASGYHVFVSSNGKTYRRLTKKGPLSGTQVTLKQLVNGRSYSFAVCSVDAEGQESKKLVRTAVPSP